MLKKDVKLIVKTYYDALEERLTLAADIREELANESMKMIVMISEIEDELGATIELRDASKLMTIGDFVNAVKAKLN